MQSWDMKKSEYRTLEVRYLSSSQNAVIFYNDDSHEYEGQKSDLDDYIAKLAVQGWKLAMGPMGPYDVKSNKRLYIFIRPRSSAPAK